MKFWSALIRTATLLAPVAILLFWGGSHLLACAEFLANPGVPLKFAYRSPGGEVTITADSYVFNTKSGDLTVVKPRVVDPRGVVLVYADRIEAQGLPTIGSASQRATVQAKNAYATIQRRADGRFDFLDYLPKQEGPPSDFPYAVTLDQAKVKYVEVGVRGRFARNVQLRDIQVDGSGKKWLASGSSTVEGSGDLELLIQNLPKQGVSIKGRTARFELASLYRIFRDTKEGRQMPELRDLDARSAIVQGPFEIFVPTNGTARFTSNLKAEFEGLRYGSDYYADQATFDGTLDADGASGLAIARNGSLKATYQAVARWTDGFEIDGDLDATSNGIGDLPRPIRFELSPRVKLDGPLAFDGRLAYREPTGLRANGKLQAKQLVYEKETLQNPYTTLDFSNGLLAMSLDSGRWRGSNVDGRLSWNTRSNEIDGAFSVSRLKITDLARRLGIDRFRGKADLDVLVTGKVDSPIAYMRMDSESTYAWNPRMPENDGRIRVTARLEKGKVVFDQAYLVSKAGSISAHGTYELASQRLALNAVGSGIDLYRLDPDLRGIGRFEAKIDGTLSKPTYRGTGELFGLELTGTPLPIITTSFFGDLHKVVTEDMRVVKGASVGQGRLSLLFKSGKLDGQFQATGVQLSDFLGEEYLASIDLPDARLTGTISQPVFTTSAYAKDILLLGSQLDSANALITLKNNIVQVDGIDIVAGGGGIEGFLSYDLTKKKGQANFTADKVGIADFVPKDLGTNVSGSFSGEAGISFDQEGFKLGSGEGKIAKVTVNDTLIGDGDWKIRADGRTITGDAYLGGLGSSIDLTGMSYEMESKLVKGNVWVRHLEVNDISKIIKRYLKISDPNLMSLLDRTNGQLGLSADLGGTLTSPNIANGGLTLEALKVGEEKAGDLKASFSRSNKNWTIDSLDWTGGPVALRAKGTLEESGAIDLEGSANGFDLRYLALYDADLANWAGKVDVSLFTVQGLTKSPTIHASAASSTQTELGGISWGSAAPGMAKVFNFDLSNILISDGTEGLSVDGNINFRGYTASVAFKAPFAFPATIPTGSPIEGTLRLQQDIATLLDPRAEPNLRLKPTLFDPTKSSGMLTGLLRVSGTRDDLGVSGNVELTAKKLGMRSGSQSFSDVFLKGSFLHDKVDLKFDAKSDFGGSLHGVANSDLPPLEQLLNAESLDEFLDSVVSGRLTAEAFALKMKIGDDGQIAATLGGELAFAGTIGKPSIKGNIDLSNTFLQMPSTLAASQETVIPTYSPELDITVRTQNPVRFKSSSADIDMVGQGTIAGTFNDLDVDALLRVQKGLLRLPTARVTIEQGGSIRPTFSLKDGVSSARLDVEIEGKTQVVAARFGQSAQRYDVTLDVKGDLLQDSGLVMVATSDPPELTQDEIFALLGQVQLIQGLAGGLQSGNAQSQFREAFLGIAVPYLLDPFTSQIANAFKLDYLTLDINALDGATISFGKSLGRNLMLSGSRQVSQTNSAYPLKYDLRLSYRLRFGSRNDRRRLNFILGTDEFRPWKIGVEYGFRF